MRETYETKENMYKSEGRLVFLTTTEDNKLAYTL